jgi:AcrR family transcriptional regulator
MIREGTMSAHTKKAILKEETRVNILEVAMIIVRQAGWEELSMRKIAAYFNFSVTMIYSYFPCKERIKLELARLGFLRLRLVMENAAQNNASPCRRLENMWKAYWKFASENNELYQIMFGVGTPSYTAADALIEHDKMALVIKTVIRDLTGWLPADEVVVTLKCNYFLALIQGLVTIHLTYRKHSDAFNQQVFMEGVKLVTNM